MTDDDLIDPATVPGFMARLKATHDEVRRLYPNLAPPPIVRLADEPAAFREVAEKERTDG